MPEAIGWFEVDSLDIELKIDGRRSDWSFVAKLGEKGSFTLRLKRPAKGGAERTATASEGPGSRRAGA